ncbi:zinc-binding dehydrogenase [Pseudonocardia xinjiangensis]|uniref:zinc-binding dehydrogenase n=1 Tax=Pseudonocardia xinjiangensis TaxID=75289 RepID=UPI003D8B2763
MARARAASRRSSAHAAVGLVDVVIRQGRYKDMAGLPQPPYVGVARTLGAAVVVGTVRRSSLAAAQASALPYDEIVVGEDLVEAVGEQRFDVVVDPVGGRLRTDSLQVMAPMGRMLLVGNAVGDWEHTVATNTLWGATSPCSASTCPPTRSWSARPLRAPSTPSGRVWSTSAPRACRWPRQPKPTAASRPAR